jgi:hypothetical protein
MEEMVTVYLLGKKYSVPATLTIMDAMEYAGFKLVRLPQRLLRSLRSNLSPEGQHGAEGCAFLPDEG